MITNEMVVPQSMNAWTIRTERLGDPIDALKLEEIEIPELADDELLVKNMAAGINYNTIWASLGKPINVVKQQKKYGENNDFIIPGSESSGIICKLGKGVKDFKVGDEVICIGIQYADNCQSDPRIDKSFRIWGYETGWGAFAEYSKVKTVQCIHKPKELPWDIAACTVATGATVYRMLTGFPENLIKKGDVVLIWGGSGGLGSIAIILTKLLEGIPIPVVSNEEKGLRCMELGAPGYLDRSKYNHFGLLDASYLTDVKKQADWTKQAMKMRRDIWKIVGNKQDPQLVIEHPGGDTLPSSMFLCDKKGMVVICGATTGYVGSLDLRHFWLGLKRLQGSHAGLREDVHSFLDLVIKNNIQIPVEQRFDFSQVNVAHQKMHKNEISGGKYVVVINNESK